MQFDFAWNTGILPDGVTIVPNGTPALTGTAVAGFNVDNQTPSPTIVSPVNGGGAYGTPQTFNIVYTSPHSGNDFSYGQVQFVGPNSNCTIQWGRSGGSPDWSCASAPSGAATLMGQLTMTSNGVSDSRYLQYDEWGRVLSYEQRTSVFVLRFQR